MILISNAGFFVTHATNLASIVDGKTAFFGIARGPEVWYIDNYLSTKTANVLDGLVFVCSHSNKNYIRERLKKGEPSSYESAEIWKDRIRITADLIVYNNGNQFCALDNVTTGIHNTTIQFLPNIQSGYGDYVFTKEGYSFTEKDNYAIYRLNANHIKVEQNSRTIKQELLAFLSPVPMERIDAFFVSMYNKPFDELELEDQKDGYNMLISISDKAKDRLALFKKASKNLKPSEVNELCILMLGPDLLDFVWL